MELQELALQIELKLQSGKDVQDLLQRLRVSLDGLLGELQTSLNI